MYNRKIIIKHHFFKQFGKVRFAGLVLVKEFDIDEMILNYLFWQKFSKIKRKRQSYLN